MKYALFAVVCSFLMAGSSFASPQELDGAEHNVAAVPQGDALSLQDILSAKEADDTNVLGGWHCTAYAEGHGHSLGYDYFDVHYNHAYYGAMNRCEQITHHHCHDVHCHYDHH